MSAPAPSSFSLIIVQMTSGSASVVGEGAGVVGGVAALGVVEVGSVGLGAVSTSGVADVGAAPFVSFFLISNQVLSLNSRTISATR